MTVLFYSPDLCQAHHPNPGHPESAARLAAIRNAVEQAALPHIRIEDSPMADMNLYTLAHDAGYIAQVEALIPVAGYNFLDDETALSPNTMRALQAATGAVLAATDKVITSPEARAFCAIRPPGHHAHRAHGGGFCFFNHIAIGALHALRYGGINRVAILDFDVHHGDGTADIVAGHPDILLASTYQAGLDGAPQGIQADNIIHRALPAGTNGAAFLDCWAQDILPKVRGFKPDMLFVSAGYDGHRDDPLADLNLTARDFGQWMHMIFALAQETCAGRLVAVLEGGYDLKSLPDCVLATLKAMTP